MGIGLYISSCTEKDLVDPSVLENVTNDQSINKDDQLTLRTWPGWPKIIFKFKHRGMLGSNCDDNSICGRCLGLCLKIVFLTWNEANQSGEADLGEGYTNVDMQNKVMTVVPTSSVDDGGGEIYVLDDVEIDSTTAAGMGYSGGSFKVQSGVYSIDYRSYTFGEIDFDIK